MKMRILLAAVVVLILLVVAARQFDLPRRLGWGPSKPEPLQLYGNVDIREVRLGFRVAGRIERMQYEEGDFVSPGYLLARLDAQPFQDRLAVSQAEQAALEATLEKLIAGPRPKEIEQARAQLNERLADLKNSELALQRVAELRERGASTQANLDQAHAAQEMARARVESAGKSLELLEEGTRKEDIAAARANVGAAKAKVATDQTALDDTELRAPSEGVILTRVQEPGAIVAIGEPIYVLALRRPVWVRAFISEPHLGEIHPGMAVEVVTDSDPQSPYQGQIGFISPVAEFTPKTVQTPELRTSLVYRLRITIDEPDSRLRQGMPVTVRLLPDSNSSL